jgi:hypothetical protein
MNKVLRIISGGQTGVDQAALSAAIVSGLECGGWCPPGRLCENGRIPDRFPLIETPVERSPDAPDVPRSLRTEWNVRDAEATLILRPDTSYDDKGTDWTQVCAEKYGKKILIVNPFDLKAVDVLKKWLRENDIRILNVAGPSEKTYPGIAEQSQKILLQALS